MAHKRTKNKQKTSEKQAQKDPILALDSFISGKEQAEIEVVASKKVSRARTVTGIRPATKLSRDEKAYFTAVVDFLNEAGLLEVVDSLLLTLLAKNYSVWKMMQDQLNNVSDYFVTHSNGTTSPSHFYNVSMAAENQILKLSTKLGLSPQDRSKMLGALASAEVAKSKSSESDNLNNLLND
jgi:P27 family predicted phage terminase small subunit